MSYPTGGWLLFSIVEKRLLVCEDRMGQMLYSLLNYTDRLRNLDVKKNLSGISLIFPI